MTPLPPLPLVDGAFLTDNSSLDHLRCPRMWEFSDLRRRSLADAKAGRNFGSCMHIGWAERYRRVGSKAVDAATVAAIDDAMRLYLNDNPQPPNDFRTFAHAQKMMAAYNGTYPHEVFKILNAPGTGEAIVERSFALPLGEVMGHPIIYTGKIDLATEDHNGIWAGPDHKTTFMFGQGVEDAWAVDNGQIGYTWAVWQVLGVRPRGYIIDAVRVRKPGKSKVDQILDFNEPGVAPIDSSDFKRIPYDVTEEKIEAWKKNTLKLIESIFRYHADGYFPQVRFNCVSKYGRCDFYDACHVAEAGVEGVLMSERYEENTWTPLNMPH